MVWLIIAAALTLFPFQLFGATEAGKVVKATGKVEIVPRNQFIGMPWKKLDGRIKVGDIVRTKRKSTADIKFIDKTNIKLLESSRLIVESYIPAESVKIKNPYGKVIFRISKRVRGSFSVETPTAIIGVKGTEFLVNTLPGSVTIIVKAGTVEITNPAFREKPVIVKAGEMVIVYPESIEKPEKLPEALINSIFSKTQTEKNWKESHEESKDETFEEIEKKEEKPEANFNVNIPYISIEGL